MTSPGYSDASTASTDYPFTMQPSYPTSGYTSDALDVSLHDDPMANSWTADDLQEAVSPSSPPASSQQQQSQPQQPAMPDAVLNMASKVGSDKKPFAYVADVNDIRQQRDRVRRKCVMFNHPATHAE